MGLRKLKEYRRAPQMRVLKKEPDEKGNFPVWMIIVMMIAIGTVLFVYASKGRNKPKTIEKYVEKVLEGKAASPKFVIAKVPSKLYMSLGAKAKTSVKQYAYVINQNSVIHIEKHHGTDNEFHKNHKAVELSDYSILRKTLLEPDSLSAGYDTKRGERTVKFYKFTDKYQYLVITVVGTEQKQFSVKTFYIKTKPR